MLVVVVVVVVEMVVVVTAASSPSLSSLIWWWTFPLPFAGEAVCFWRFCGDFVVLVVVLRGF